MKIDIRNNILTQFAEHFDTKIIESEVVLKPEVGIGKIKLTEFPDTLELYDFEFKLKAPFQLESVNPTKSNWLLLNINLSQISVDKTVNNELVNIQRYLPSGILLYTQNTNVSSVSLPETPYSVVLIRFKSSYLHNYMRDEIKQLNTGENAVIYEDLDAHMEMLLRAAINYENNKLKRHACTLEFLSIFLDKLKHRAREDHYENLHPTDIKGLFLASTHLRNPISTSTPSIPELAAFANMGTTKFKTTFKQVFGLPPLQYHQKIKMKYAKKELLSKSKTISEISYEIGYSHPSKFTAAFKKHFGSLPSQI